MLSQAEKEVLTSNFADLVYEFPYDSLIARIVSANIFDPAERSMIESKSTREEKNRLLFDKIVYKPSGTFKTLCTLYSKVESVQAQVGKELLQQIEKLAGGDNSDGPQKQDKELTTGIVDGSKPAKPYIKEIYKEVADDWVNLAIALNIEKGEINKIKKENPFDINEQCHTMLYKHSRKLASSFTKSMLIKALLECELGDIVEKIAPMSL